MSEIYDFPLSYNLLKRYVIFSFKLYYGEFIITGKENIPDHCPLIFAPNHTNALMDAIAIASLIPDTVPMIFLARADIFKKKAVAKALNFVKIMPAFRMRDGLENLGQNSEVFERCREVLDNNKALGIMPEGNQEIERYLRPLVKGIFRISFAAQKKYGDKPGVKIIPVGLDYGDIIKAGKHIIINIGKPIEVSDYMDEYAENSVIATNHIREQLKEDLCNLSLNLATDKYYPTFETAVEVCNTAFVKQMQLTDNTLNRFVARQQIAERLAALERDKPKKAKELDSLCEQYSKTLNSLNLRNWVLENRSYKKLALTIECLALILTFPIFIYGLITNFFPFFTPEYLRKNVFKTEFTGFFSSLQFGTGIILFPLFYAVETLLFAGLTGFPWWVCIMFLLSFYPFGKLALKWNNYAKKFFAKLRFNKYRRTKPDKIEQTQNIREQIIKIVKS
jgi:1-acyl-sn-glycerol-3-phosphate acyltransferase